jgi:chromosome segregation ATPase
MEPTPLQQEIAHLRAELRNLEQMDEPTRAELQRLERRIEALLDEQNEEETVPEQVISHIEEAATSFAARHPKAEGLLRKISYALGRMGI